MAGSPLLGVFHIEQSLDLLEFVEHLKGNGSRLMLGEVQETQPSR
jgi:hypothetical protein